MAIKELELPGILEGSQRRQERCNDTALRNEPRLPSLPCALLFPRLHLRILRAVLQTFAASSTLLGVQRQRSLCHVTDVPMWCILGTGLSDGVFLKPIDLAEGSFWCQLEGEK